MPGLREQLHLGAGDLKRAEDGKGDPASRRFRRMIRSCRDRVDQEAEAMAQPADPQSVLQAIKEIHAEAEQIIGLANGP